MATTESNHFDLFVTCVDKVGPMLKIWGQVDRLSSMFVEQLIKTISPQFELQTDVIHFSKLSVGLVCCAKYKDGHYYRAKITSLRHLVSGSIEVKFIDYGNVEIITIENIRLLENVPSGLSSIKAQAVDFVLANVIHVNQKWDDQALSFIHSEIAYTELKSTIIGAINGYRFIKIMFYDNDLSEYLIQRGLAAPVSLVTQETLIKSLKSQIVVPAPQFSSVPAPVPSYSTIQAQPHHHAPMSPMAVPELCTYKTLPLEPNSEHMVYISYVEDGPYLFSVQLQSMEEALEKLMIEINQINNLLPLSESPLPGYPCMARCLEDNSLCRAVVINIVEDKCKTYYVDFGNTDILPATNIFQIPFKYILPKAMSMRFTLVGLKNMKVTNEMKCAFKEYVTNRLLKLKVLAPDSTPVLQYCELYDNNNMNIINVLYDQINEYKILPISKNQKFNVIVSFIEGCKKFFVQLKECSDSLNNLMLALADTCENAPPLQEIESGTPCVAFYSGDNQWYRAVISSVTNDTATVKYVDYGNEDIVPINTLKKIHPDFVKMLPAQAIECCLYGYQNMSFNNEIESVFESLTLECEFTMRVISKQNNDKTLLVDLFDAAGNNVAALLIEKLAAQKSQISPLPVNKITRALLNNEENINPNTEAQYVEIKSPQSPEKPSWRNTTNETSWRSTGVEKKNFRNTNEEKKFSRNDSQESLPKNRAQNDNWNGDSPTNKRSQRNERTFSRNENSFQSRDGGKFNKRSPQNDSGKGNSWNNSGSESEKSWSGNKKDFKQGRRNDYPKKEFNKERRKVELPPQDLAPLTQPFDYMEVAPGAQESVSISWFYNPEYFFCQFIKNEKEFRDMMNDIQSAYNGRPPVNGDIPVGASVIAEFHEDSILYRATILENKYPKFKVQYIDFGNMSWVDNNKIWQVEKRFMNLPMQAIKCSINNIAPSDSGWPMSNEIDKYFNKDTFSCTFVGCDAEKYFIQLFDNDVDVRQQIIDSGLARDPTACQMVDDLVILHILIGQNIQVRLSFIQGLNKFYVHLKPEVALNVQESIDSFMKTVDVASLPQEQITVGSTCVVQTDEFWKRGVIISSDETAIEIEYPDFGGSGIVSSDKIYVLPQELCVHWYQAFQCSLHNLADDNQIMSDDDFKLNFEGQELIAYVDGMDEDRRLIVTLYDLTGAKLDLIDPDEGAYSSVEPICPRPILAQDLSVYVSHINNANSLYLQLDSDANKIAALLEKLYEFYESKEDTSEFKQGDYCCAKSENDGNWYRGKVEEITDEGMKVLYIDYGNSEILPKDNLKVLDSSFYNHEYAVHVSLNLEEISPELTSKMIELTADKLFVANFSHGDSDWTVTLLDGEVSLTQTLIDLNLAAPAKFEPIEELIEENEDETRAQITITHIDSPSEFYVQLTANEDFIYNLQTDLQEKVKELPDLEGADIGVLCAAKYAIDEQWYRAEVLDADSDITTVRFVDYGNTDVINNNSGAIKTLPADLLAIDKYARKCSLNIAPNKGEEWSQEAAEIFEKAVNVDIIHADIVYQDEKNKTFVDLFVDGNNIAEQLLSANLAVAITRDAEDKLANNTGFVSHVNSISEFWIQLESSVPDLEMIVDRLANADSFSDLQDLSPGILCAANFPDDEMWYRARILSNTVAGIEVLFVDYGNSSTAMKLKVLPEDLIQMPILGQKCSLNKPSNVTNWSETANEKFREISEDGATIFTIKKLTAGETSVVELFIDGNNILDQLIELCDEKADRMTPIGEPNYTKVHVTHIEGPSYFWVQLLSDLDKIEDMTENLATGGSFKKLSDWNADTTCAALYIESGLWYRAKILESLGEEYEVLLVDYGNVINTKDLRALPDEIATVAPLANLCTLELPTDLEDWTEEMGAKFISIADSKECRAEFINNEFPSTVRLFIDGKNVVELISADVPQDSLPSASTANLITEEVSLLAVNTHLPETVQEIDEEEMLEVEPEQTSDSKEPKQISDLEEVPKIELEQTLDLEEVPKIEQKQTSDLEEIPKIEQKQISEVQQKLEETSIIDESYSTAIDENEECTLDDSSETLKDDSINQPESVTTDTNQDNITVDATELTPLDTNEQENLTDNEITSNHNDTVQEEILTPPGKEIKEEVVKTSKEETEISLTPRNEKIVPGSICRGDLEEPTKELDYEEVITEVQEIIKIPSRPVTPHSEKIVPGSICRGSLEEVPPGDENLNIPITPHNDKIVPGAICRGDLEKPPANVKKPEIPETVILEEIRPKTPIEDKIVPGSINKGVELLEDSSQ